MDVNQNQKAGSFLGLEKLPFIVLTCLFALLPIFFVFSPFVSLQFSKTFLLSIGIVAACVCFLILTIKRGSITVSKSLMLGSFGVVTLACLVSSLFSPSFSASAFGYGFETSTFSFTLLMLLLAYLVSVTFNTSRRLFTANLVFVAIAGLLAVFYILRICVGPQFLSFGLFTSTISNLIGKWSELSIFFGASAIASLIALETLKVSRIYRIILYVILALSLVMVAVVDFVTVWYALGVVVLLTFVFHMASSNFLSRMSVAGSVGNEHDGQETRLTSPKKKIAVKTLVVAVIAVLFILPLGRDLTKNISGKFGLNNLEVRPSWSATYGIFKNTTKSSPVLGAGPNRFATQWELYRPDVNSSDFWNLSFDQGVGFVPTAFVETGILGTIAWLVFFAVLLYSGFKALTVRNSDPIARYFVLSSFAITIFLWVMNILYAPGAAIVALTFFFTALFIASSVYAGSVTTIQFSFSKNHTLSLVATSLCVLGLIASIGLGYLFFQQGLSSFYFQKGVNAVRSAQDFDTGEMYLRKALGLAKNDLYYRTLADLNTLRVTTIVAKVGNRTDVSEDEKMAFQNALAASIESARMAQNSDATKFENHFSVATAYENAVPVGIEGTYEASKAAYQEAIKRSPRNPFLYLGLARLETEKPKGSDFTVAEGYIAQALALKWNYVDAIFLQSQIDVAKGNLAGAIKAAQQVAAITPNDPLIFFRVGILKYEAKDYAGAVANLEKSISLVPVYANARYFLGLSYAKLGRNKDAIAQFEDLRTTNPESQEIILILANLRAGRDPFADAAAASVDSKPEKRKTLPVSEDN